MGSSPEADNFFLLDACDGDEAKTVNAEGRTFRVRRARTFADKSYVPGTSKAPLWGERLVRGKFPL